MKVDNYENMTSHLKHFNFFGQECIC